MRAQRFYSHSCKSSVAFAWRWRLDLATGAREFDEVGSTFVNIDLSDIVGGIGRMLPSLCPSAKLWLSHGSSASTHCHGLSLGAVAAKCIFGRSVCPVLLPQACAAHRSSRGLCAVSGLVPRSLYAQVQADWCKELPRGRLFCRMLGRGARPARSARICMSLLVYVPGIPMLTLGILRCNKAHLDESSPRHKTLMLSVGSLYSRYESQY